MFELDIEMLKEQGLQLVDSAKKTAQDLADKGKNKLDLLNQQARLSKAQETAENTEPEAAPAEDEEIEEEPIQLRGETKTCPVCKAEVDGDALFCNHCGAQL